MARENPPFFKPPANALVRVWRYMDLKKFVWMLDNKALYFPRVTTMNDPYEGHYTIVMAPSEESEKAFMKMMAARPNSHFSLEREDHREQAARRISKLLKGAQSYKGSDIT